MLGTPLVAGREFDWTDIHDRRDVVLISENFAREYWGSAANAIGKQIRSNPNDPWSQVIGVVADIRHDGVDRPAPSTVYWRLRDDRSVSLMLRGPRAGTGSFAAEIRSAVAAQSAGVPITQMRSMQEVYEQSMARTALTLTLLGISGAMALLLAVVGIYALISYTVSQRTREIGIRMALGAQQGSVKRMFVGYGLTWAGVGAAAGFIAAVPLSRLMSALLFEVKPLDPLTYAAVGAGLLGAAADRQLSAGAPCHPDPTHRGAAGRVAMRSLLRITSVICVAVCLPGRHARRRAGAWAAQAPPGDRGGEGLSARGRVARDGDDRAPRPRAGCGTL